MMQIKIWCSEFIIRVFYEVMNRPAPFHILLFMFFFVIGRDEKLVEPYVVDASRTFDDYVNLLSNSNET